MKKYLILIILPLLIGCVGDPIKFDPDIKPIIEGKAIVFFYMSREFHFKTPTVMLTLDYLEVVANDISIGTVSNGVYVKHYFEPGDYKIHSVNAGFIDRISTFTFYPNRIYYINIWLDRGVWVKSIRFTRTLKPLEF